MPPTDEPVRRWRVLDLHLRLEVPHTTAAKLRAAMARAGVLSRLGGAYFGRASDIDAWLLGQGGTEGL